MLYLAFSPDKYPLVVTVIYILKVVRASGTMCFYLNEKYDSLNIYSILLSICYSYCAFSTVYYQNIMWFDAMILLPVVAYGIEKLVKGNSVAVYIISLFLTIISNFYTGYMVCIFCVIYFIYEIIVTKSKTVISNFKNFFLSSLTAGGMSAFLIIPMFFDVLKAKGVGSGISLTFTNAFKFSEFFYKLFPFNFSWQEVHNGLPNVYTGLICLCGIALFIASKNITLKEKITSSAVVVILF